MNASRSMRSMRNPLPLVEAQRAGPGRRGRDQQGADSPPHGTRPRRARPARGRCPLPWRYSATASRGQLDLVAPTRPAEGTRQARRPRWPTRTRPWPIAASSRSVESSASSNSPRSRARSPVYHPIMRGKLDIFRYGNVTFGDMARAATTTDVFNAVAEPRRRQILETSSTGKAACQRPRTQARTGSTAGVQTPTSATGGRSSGRKRRRPATGVPTQRARARTDPRLLGEATTSAVMVPVVRRDGRRIGRAQDGTTHRQEDR